jgi:putative ABC transport system permease protein
MVLLFFLKLAFRRLRSQAAYSLLLALNFALTLGLLVCIPVFSNAVGLRLMQEELSKRVAMQNHPAFSVRIYAMPTDNLPITIETAFDRRAWLADRLQQALHLPVKSGYMAIEAGTFHLRTIKGDTHTRQTKSELDDVRPTYVADIESHINVITGTAFGKTPPGAQDSDIAVWVERYYAQSLDLQAGDRYDLGRADANAKAPAQVVIAGIWEAKDRADPFWYQDPVFDFNKRLATTRAQFEQRLSPLVQGATAFDAWFFVMDESRVNLDQGEFYIAALKAVAGEANQRLPSGKMDNAPFDELAQGQQRKLSLELILAGFAAPLVATLVYFIVSVSAMAARFQRREIALLSSRGGSRDHILLLISLESLLVLLAALPLGVAAGMGLAHLLGYSSSFLQFATADRVPLPVSLSSVDWRVVGAGLLVCLLARLWPTWQASRFSIVTYERRSARPLVETPIGVRLFLLAILLGVTFYAYRQLALKGTLGVVSWNLDQPSNDPLLLAAPTLFLLTMPLAVVELYMLSMRLVSLLAGALPFSSAYLSFMHLGREGGQYRAPVYLLVLCLTLGVFYASVAKSADAWLVERRQYEAGADLRFTPVRPPPGALGTPAGPPPSDQQEDLLPLESYQHMTGVADAMFVGQIQAVPSLEGWADLQVFAIDRVKFPQIANFRRDFAADSLGEMMNRLGATENGIIVPEHLLEQTGLKVGDNLPLNLILASANGSQFTFKIVDSYRYFPTVYEDAPAAIVNASYIDTLSGGGYTDEVWMKLKPNAAGASVIAQVEENRLFATKDKDLRAILRDDQQRLERVGVFGLLSACFVAGALLAGLGILAYSLSSVTARSQRFAALQAMGMLRRDVVRTVVIEYAMTLGYGLVCGAALGVAASVLYVPLFPLTDVAVIPVPPFAPLIDWQRATWIASVMGVTLLTIIVAVLVKVARARIFEILRMGGLE